MPVKKKSTPKPGDRKRRAVGPPADWRVRIRMHRQGVGDCFLVTFKNGGSPVHMLFDCGVLPASPAEFNHLEAVTAAVRDEVIANGGTLDVIVVTHEHADHVSGFEPKKKATQNLDGVPVKQVWMAWTEDPDDKIAKKLNGQLGMQALAAAAILPKLKAAATDERPGRFNARAGESAADVADILSNWGLPDGQAAKSTGQLRLGAAVSTSMGLALSTTVRAAMEHVKSRVPESGFLKFRPGEPPHAVPGIPKDKVRVFVLGPPRIEDLDKSPRHGPKDDIFHLVDGDIRAQAYSLAVAAAATDDPNSRPFEKVTSGQASSSLKKLKKRYNETPWRRIDSDWLLAGAEFAMQLDSATNNTSLVLAIELVETGEVLLFPGDAQIENWETWRNVKWKLTDAAGTSSTVTGEDLLRRTVFYKVGHHGSHNGTLDVHGLQLMPSSGLVAMCPVVHAVTSKRKGDWKQIPKQSLCTALENKCGDGFLRMDAPQGMLGGRLGGRVQETELWVDYFLV
ncbi:MAG: hypothetical protein JWP89_6896 [Schlesneria sp.]|nr:hypothetical protein [Schlesneria sp.]